MNAFAEYAKEIKKNLEIGDSTEHTHRPALKRLLEETGKDIVATNEPRRIVCGAPDFNITRKGTPVGHIETKDIGVNLDDMERGRGPNGEQFKRYSILPNWILTDYLEFRWYAAGQKRLTVRMADIDNKGRVKTETDYEEKLAQLLSAFFQEPALTVASAKELAERIAGMTHIIRDLIVNTFKHEKEQNWLHRWIAAFRETLIPDIDEQQFADMFAQTLSYGLFAARIHAPPNMPFTREMAAYNLPKTNPFLRKLFSEIAGVDMPDSLVWAVNDIVELLKHADMHEILKDFGKGDGKEDPVVHFYETFLAAYDPRMREIRGVYYTPVPVVKYIVGSIDHLLKTRFNRPKGLADENTLILDPATGTATFLYFVIDQIRHNLGRQLGSWDDYVAKHLLNRIFGFELLMAPYAIAHLKLGMQLQETGYKFGSDQRLGIYLTNTLEEAAKKTEQLFAAWIADEANAAAKIKSDDPILVVLGNPPYSKFSANRSRDGNGDLTFIGKLIEDYKFVDGHSLDERNPKALQDDYVKFMRFAQWRIEKTEEGVIGFITNHGYLDNQTFRGMRQSLMHSFNEIFIYNLHGNIRKAESNPDGSIDENVFDIQQGVSIILCVKQRGNKTSATIKYADLWGNRSDKYQSLLENDLQSTKWKKVTPSAPLYLFLPQDKTRHSEYEKGWLVTKIFGTYMSTVTTSRNDFSVAFDADTLVKRISDLQNKAIDDETIRAKHQLIDVSYWNLAEARKALHSLKDLHNYIKPYCYRPFDFRFVFYHNAVCDRLRSKVMRHMQHGNIAFLTHRPQSPSEFTFAYCTRMIGDQCIAANKSVGGGNSFQFPLYLYNDDESKTRRGGGGIILMSLFEPSPDYSARRANLNPEFINDLTHKLGVKWLLVDCGDLKKTVGPEDVLHYAYAVFHSPTYRKRYAEFLKTDFPRLLLTGNLKLFGTLAAKGAELVSLHLMESPKLDDFITEWPVKGDNIVETVKYTENNKRVWINNTQYFGGVPKAVWEFQIGGYTVCEKWLKDRKNYKLTYEDTQHYQKIVVALKETIRLMGAIDAAIETHGGWPDAFSD